jgi:hypothetical protein
MCADACALDVHLYMYNEERDVIGDAKERKKERKKRKKERKKERRRKTERDRETHLHAT